ncbi:unnamed protein product [Ophioblennius macclurei]
MAELEIDQSNLPRVQEVRQCFAVLEDGVLAHNLQEQEIEQYYSTNIQKNQLVQNDIRVAKRLQDEEEEQRAQQTASHRHASRQIEEEDFEYARVIQEEIQRCADEARRREQDDQELAKRMQEEEEQQIVRRRSSRGHEGHGEDNSSDSALPHQHQQHTFDTRHEAEERCSPSATRWQRSTSHDRADSTGPQTHAPKGVATQENRTSWSNQGHSDSVRQSGSERRESPGENSEDSDAVYAEQLSVCYQRLCERLQTAPRQQRASSHQSQERNSRSLCPRGSYSDELRGLEEEEEERYYENDEVQRRRPRTYDQERRHRNEDERRSRGHEAEFTGFRRRSSRSESVRIPDRTKRTGRELARTLSCNDNPDRHVHFRENDYDGDRSSYDQRRDRNSRVWEMLGHILRERGVPVRFGGRGAPLQIRPQSRDSQVLHGSEVSCGDSPPHQRRFQRAASARHSFHGDVRQRRRLSCRENGGRDHREDGGRRRDNGEIYEISSRDLHLSNGERRGSGRWRRHKNTDNYVNDDDQRIDHNHRVRRTTSERRRRPGTAGERFSSEEEEREAELRAERPRRRAAQHSQSFSGRASGRFRSRHVAAGSSLQPEPSQNTSLDLGELQQVLEDEELARKLQEEEENVLRRNSQPPPSRSYPEGDFRVAQVAQDEEIARFMQKQEIKAKRQSRELEGPSSWREHRAMISQHDRRAGRERHVPRERLDSEGLPSPTEDCSPENLPPSPISTLPPASQIRNVAEDLDPTFQARRQGTARPAGPNSSPPSQSDFVEEPSFIPPTKRHGDKSGRSKPKDKKENCKQQ